MNIVSEMKDIAEDMIDIQLQIKELKRKERGFKNIQRANLSALKHLDYENYCRTGVFLIDEEDYKAAMKELSE